MEIVRPCRRPVRRKFEITNQDSTGRKTVLSCRQMHVNRKGIEVGHLLSLETKLNIHEKKFIKNITQTAYNSQKPCQIHLQCVKGEKLEIFCVFKLLI